MPATTAQSYRKRTTQTYSVSQVFSAVESGPMTEEPTAAEDQAAYNQAVNAIFDQLNRAARRGTGCRLTADMVQFLTRTSIGEAIAGESL